MSHNKNVLLIGGPADGTRITLSMAARIYNCASNGLPDNEDDAAVRMADRAYDAPTSAEITTYAVGTIQGAFHEVFHVGYVELNTCILCELVAGYRKPRKHITDVNVAKQLVTLLGGSHDGLQVVVATNDITVTPNSHRDRRIERGDMYKIVPLICKDGTEIRVGVLDMMTVDPIRTLVEGYRMAPSEVAK